MNQVRTPREVRSDVYSIFEHSSEQSISRPTKVVYPIVIKERLLERHTTFVLDGEPILGDAVK